ncbi:MAG: aspartate/glutamate racemase family protein [Asticcacaulis sp.]
MPGAGFFVCAANTPHGVLDLFIDQAPIPCLHIADAVSAVIAKNGWRRAGILGTRSTMTGTVYDAAFARFGIAKLVPEASVHARFDEIVFQEVNQGEWLESSRLDWCVKSKL